MSLDQEYMEDYRQRTSEEPTYKKDGATYHTLGYVDYLEGRLRAMEEQRADKTGRQKLHSLCKRIVNHADAGIDLPAGHSIIDDIRKQLRAGA